MPTAYASARNGLWDASDVDTWGLGANQYPGDATHAFVSGDTIAINHTVTYNIANVWGAIEGLSRAAACVVTATGHGLATGDAVWFTGITQDGVGQWPTLNSPSGYAVTYIDANSFSIAVNTSAYTNAYVPATDPGTLCLKRAHPAINYGSGGILTWVTNASTKLLMSHNDISIGSTGELRVGASGAVVGAAYTAELIWNTTGDNNKGISVNAGGKLNVYGDPSYYGSNWATTLVEAESISNTEGATGTIKVAGDFTTKWAIGQELVIHKGGTYSTNGWYLDFARITITGLTLDGSNTDIDYVIIDQQATGAISCAVNADVVNVSRNVTLYKLGYDMRLGQNNSNRPRITNSNSYSTGSPNGNVNFNNATGGAFYGFGYSCLSEQGFVIRNGYGFGGFGVSFTDFIAFALYVGIINGSSTFLDSGQLFASSASITQGLGFLSQQFINCKFYGNGSAIANTVTGYCTNVYLYSNGVAINNGGLLRLSGCTIGYNTFGDSWLNTQDYSNGQSLDIYGISCKLPTSFVFNNMNQALYKGRLRFEGSNDDPNAHIIFDNLGYIEKVAADGTGDNPSARSGGNAYVLEIHTIQSNVATVPLELLHSQKVRIWAEAGVSITYRFYIQTDYVTLPSAELKLYGEYLSAVSGGTLTTVSSTQDITTRANAADWSQYVEVTINPAQDGFVNLYMRLMGYESGKKVWVDPKMMITGGDAVTVTPRLSYGEVVIDVDAAGGGGVNKLQRGFDIYNCPSALG